MKTRILRELTLYRFRYVFGYGVFVVILTLSMLVLINTVPGGLSQAEMDSSVKSMQINPRAITPLNVVDVPYHALQKASISIFGLTTFAIKLPSVIIAIATGLSLVVMLRKWFRDNVAVVSGLLAVTSVPFLTVGRTGTAVVMTFFWTTLLLLAASRALHSKSQIASIWKAVGLIAGLALLYSPLGIYPLIALIISGLLHPHVRHMFRTTRPVTYGILFVIGALSIAPLVIAIVSHPAITLTLLGIDPSQFNSASVAENIRYLITLFVNPRGTNTINGAIIPLFGIATLALILLGLLKTVSERHSARSYMIFIWLGFLLPILILNPTLPYVIFIPIILLLAIGTETLIREWYDLFPFNPYARIGALLPLAILLGSIMTTNLFRYFYGNIYLPSDVMSFNQLTAIRQGLDRDDVNKSKFLLIANDNAKFYDLLRRDYPKLSVATTGVALERGTSIVVTGAQAQVPALPHRVVTSSDSTDAKILTIYTKW